MAVFPSDYAMLNNKIFQNIRPGLNYYNNELIVPESVYNNNHIPHRLSPYQVKKSKKKRTKFSNEQLYVLEASFSQEKYPSKRVQVELAKQLRIEQKIVTVWFQNRRAKYRKFHRVPSKVMLDHSAREVIQNIVHRYDGYCPTCLLPVHYRSYTDGRWIYCRALSDDKSGEPKVVESKTLHRDDRCPGARDLNNDLKKNEEGYQSDDFDSILREVEMLCK